MDFSDFPVFDEREFPFVDTLKLPVTHVSQVAAVADEEFLQLKCECRCAPRTDLPRRHSLEALYE